MASSEKMWKKEKWRKKKKKKRKKKKVKHGKRRWWEKCKDIIMSPSMMRRKKGEKEKESRRRARRPKARQTLGNEIRKWFFLLIMGQNWLSVSAAAEGPQRSTEVMTRMQQEVQIKESSWAEVVPIRWKQPKGEDRTGIKTEARTLRCKMLNGSAWSTEKNTGEDTKESATSSWDTIRAKMITEMRGADLIVFRIN